MIRYAAYFLLLLSSCVSLSDYKAVQRDLAMVNDSNKVIKKEIRQLEKSIALLSDSLQRVRVRSALLSTKIQKRLALKNIVVNPDPEKLKLLTVRNQDISDEYYQTLRTTCNFTDTNSARNTPWLTDKEKKLIYWLNFARLDPQLFCQRYIVPLCRKESDNVYLATLLDYMLHMKPVPVVYPDKALFESAKCHAETMGKKGLIGHGRVDGCKSQFSGECCSYGLSDPLAVVIQLLVDEHVTSLGHRYICLGTYSKIGVSFQPHKSYGTNVVLDFGYYTSW